MDEQQIEAIIERAAKRGAKEALESIGLHDDDAIKDVYGINTSNVVNDIIDKASIQEGVSALTLAKPVCA